MTAFEARAEALSLIPPGDELSLAELEQHLAKARTQDLLDDLHELGVAWRDIARMVDVTVPALQKWRRGQKCSGENKIALTGLLAACHLIQDKYMVDEVASWFEMPVVPGFPVTPIDMYANGDRVLLFEHASGHTSPEEVLDAYQPAWRDEYNSPYKMYRAEDGHLSIGIETL